jgi:hypothetical protein
MGADDQQLELLGALEALGGSAGNGKLRDLLGWDEATYDAVKGPLIATGQLQSGRGRGGSVSLAGSEKGDEAEQAGLESTHRPNGTTPRATPAVPGAGPQPTGKQNLSAFIWSVADLLRGDYKQSDYGKVILPFTVLRRLDCLLEPTKTEVLEEKTAREGQGLDPVPFLLRKAGQNFCNSSPLDMKRLMGDQDNIGENLRSYIQAFTPEVRDIFESFEFHLQVDRLEKAGLLYMVCERFAQIDLHPETVSNAEMGLVIEELIRKFAELSNETAGEHFTPREVIRLMVNLIFIEDDQALTQATQLFGRFEQAEQDGKPISRIFRNEDFGYSTITVERPLRDEAGKVVVGQRGKAKGQPQADSSLRDTENVPLSEDVQTYFEREVLPHVPDAWIDHEKTKMGYEIPFNRHFYVFTPPRPLEVIDAELKQVTDRILAMIGGLSG